jgi:mono/diheme cytochrome c family protein
MCGKFRTVAGKLPTSCGHAFPGRPAARENGADQLRHADCVRVCIMRTMGLIIFCSLALGGALLTTGATAATQSQAVIEKGEKVYVANKCSTCHSIDGKGAKKGPLDGVGSKLSEADIRAWIVDAVGMAKKTKAERKPAMKNYKLPKDDIDALVAYMVSLKKPLK